MSGQPAKKSNLPALTISLSIVVLIALLAWGVWSVYSVLGVWGSDAVLAPIRLGIQLYPITILTAIAVAALVFFGLSRKALWFLLPLGMVVAGVAWAAACITVVKLIRDAM